MLWQQDGGGDLRRVPVIILLGPAGSGKSRALMEIHEHLSWGVVHARFDFERDEPPTTVEVLIQLVYELSRKWRHRPKPRFTKFTLALLAVEAKLLGRNRADDKKELLNRLAKLRHPWLGGLPDLATPLVSTLQAMGLVPPPAAELTKHLAAVLEGARQSVGDAKRALDPGMDALIDLSKEAREKNASAVAARLTEAFLADVGKDHRRMSAPDKKGVCDCVPDKPGSHVHKWVLLLDNVDHPGGVEFLAELARAREGAGDPLLVVGSSGRWNHEWERRSDRGKDAWRPPWEPAPREPDGRGTVPLCHEADYRHWEMQSTEFGPPRYYPALLDALQNNEIARILGPASSPEKLRLADRATGGLPKAVHRVKKALGEPTVEKGTRDALCVGDPWHDRLAELSLTAQVKNVTVSDFVTAAPFATAPWLIPVAADGLVHQPHVVTIIEELRNALWVTARTAGENVTDQVTLHPWLATNLVCALAARDDHPSYVDQFAALLADQDDDLRRAYCQLALEQIVEVVTLFEQDFNQRPHDEWVDRLTVVVHAPNNLPRDRGVDELYGRLVEIDREHGPQDRTELRNIVARLIAASWLAADPFTVRSPDQNTEIVSTLQDLARGKAQRTNITKLDYTAELAAKGLWP
jgi:hypothetical protein